ncbi:MAG: CDP-alcohol phosphatidyltransferase family protein [Pseudomonadota bacterium]
MEQKTESHRQLPKRITALLIYGRPPLAFSGMLCAIAVMLTQNPLPYLLGVSCLFISMTFDLVDGWFAARFHPNNTMAQLADRIMDKIVYSIIFPLLTAGMMWRMIFINPSFAKIEFLHAIFILFICVTVLIRDNFASFMRGFAIRRGQEPESSEFTRLRTIVAAPLGALLYAHAFLIPDGPAIKLYSWISWLGNIPIRVFFVFEIVFLIINFGSIAGYCRKYGTYCLDELCLGNEHLRKQILAIFPNALTVMNAMMGLLAVFFAYQGRIKEAFLIMIGAAIFDKLDGAMARKLGLADDAPAVDGKHKITFGGIMDDIADTVSFCVAPAWIYYICLSEISTIRLPVHIIAIVYAVFGISRLIYFTLDKHPIPGYFKGMPTPAAALFVTSPLIILAQAFEQGSDSIIFWYYFCSGIMVAAAFLMNLFPAKYVHVGRMMDKNPWIGRIDLPLVVLFSFTPYLGYFAFIQLLLYAISPIMSKRNAG